MTRQAWHVHLQANTQGPREGVRGWHSAPSEKEMRPSPCDCGAPVAFFGLGSGPAPSLWPVPENVSSENNCLSLSNIPRTLFTRCYLVHALPALRFCYSDSGLGFSMGYQVQGLAPLAILPDTTETMPSARSKKHKVMYISRASCLCGKVWIPQTERKVSLKFPVSPSSGSAPAGLRDREAIRELTGTQRVWDTAVYRYAWKAAP